FAVHAWAEDQPYSADSLMATFKKGSTVSIKGNAITFAGVVVEVKKSTVTFKSSENDKVICESVSPIVGATVGQPLTVTGKVRGRGLLGNVTLDGCGPVAKAFVVEKAPEIVVPVNEIYTRPTATVEVPVAEPPVSAPTPNAPPASAKRTTP